MILSTLDWAIVLAFFALTLAVGLWVSRQAGKSSSEYFLSGRDLPWWLLGFSMVATTFSTDTPNLVTDLVRSRGVAGNWSWWAFLLTGMLTVFLYAALWRRSEILTDVEFYEIRYSGASAAFLRGFRAVYLGVFFNVVIMASVTLAAIKIGGTMLGLTPAQSVAAAMLVTVIFSTLGGFRGVIITDFLLFIVAMIGAFAAAYVALQHPQVGGLQGLLTHPAVMPKLAMIPPLDWSTPESRDFLFGFLIVPLAVQWWSVWYPGAEPGGGGYLVQRMLAARNEKEAVAATLFFNFAHYAIRPWPWILVALASLIVFPDLASIQQAFPHVPADKIGNDLGYSAMLTFLPPGVMGLMLASLLAAYMSTIATHLNWGSSYVVNDVYKRFDTPGASAPTLVNVGRLSTVVMMVLAALLSLQLTNAVQAFQIMLQIGAGTGLLFILRWFWWRINPWSELAAMVVSFVVTLFLQLGAFAASWPEYQKIVVGVLITTVSWLVVALVTPPSDEATLREFVRRTNPGGPGWQAVMDRAERAGAPIRPLHDATNVPRGLLCTFLGTVAVYAGLFGSGMLLYGQTTTGTVTLVVGLAATVALFRVWQGMRLDTTRA
ncbi:sodium:solute symporter family protein [Luteitalea sp.]|uniref:sodium:solute symporter family protein n=1 Tax=Luteitalea sp. TaxID=2004800 RepID=UPI0025B9F84C|nr:sodium:solute symporter family protein [Luteitalea sp.]